MRLHSASVSSFSALAFGALFILPTASALAAKQDSSISGLWDATIVANQLVVPFPFAFVGTAENLQGQFFNGDEPVASTSGRLVNNQITLVFAHYGTRLEATLQDGRIKGTYGRPGKPLYPFQAVPKVTQAPAVGEVPNIDGRWEIAVQSPKGEKAWHLLVQQNGGTARATILRVDGDTGTLAGTYREGRFVLSHFSGARPGLLVLTPNAEGGLDVDLRGRGQYKALRPAQARAKGLAAPTDPATNTTVADPNEPFHFAFRDLAGTERSESEERFLGKVVLVNITGSWCPNCHDEAPFLADLYQRFRAKGLEIVALSFEEAEQLADPTRLKAFVEKYGITYTVLLGGEPSQVQEKLPQARNLNSWPTTFFLGRDGKVRHVHTGFPGKASGLLHEEAKRQFVAQVETLLAETQPKSSNR